MDIVSYRGPHAPGGVSNVLQTVFYDPRLDLSGWWYFARNRFKRLSRFVESSLTVSALPEDLVQSHYSYCNQYLWPAFHGFFHHADYDAKMRLAYHRANRMFAETLAHCRINSEVFVHDYQLALVPRFLRSSGMDAISFFWHIPWPATTPDEFVDRVLEIAMGIAAADKIGFQTDKDANNFVQFCHRYLPERVVEDKVCVAPVAIDHELWSMLSQDELRAHELLQSLSIKQDEKVVLSVERADYTKGVLERLDAIETFLSSHNDWANKIRFVEVLPRTRSGLPAYDNYWQDCAAKVLRINRLFQTADWQPILWLEEPLGGPDLAVLYSRADAMLITSIADGLNLTAKEFIIAAAARPGALILSKECGVARELGDSAFLIDPHSKQEIVGAMVRALKASNGELQERVSAARNIVVQNDPACWLSSMRVPAPARPLARVT